MQNIFQVEFYTKTDNNTFYLDGRFIEGDVITIGDVFTSLVHENKYYDINFTVSKILMYNRLVPFIDIGMTGRIFFHGNFTLDIENGFEIIYNNNK